MRSDSYGWIWNGLVFLERKLDLDRNWTGESDRCDRTRLDPELELMFLSRTDVVGLNCGSGTFTAWRNRDLHCLSRTIRSDSSGSGTGTYVSESEMWSDSVVDPGLSLLGGLRDLHCLADSAGTGTVEVERSDRCDRTRLDPELELMFLSRTDVVGLSCGSGTFTAWRNRDLDCLADSGTLTAWRTPGPWEELELVSRIDVIGLVRTRYSEFMFRESSTDASDPSFYTDPGTSSLLRRVKHRTFTWAEPDRLLPGNTVWWAGLRCDLHCLDPELGLHCFWVGLDVVPDSLADSGTFTAWRTPGPWQLGGLRDFHCLAEPGPSLLGGLRDLDCLAESGTLTAWRTPGPWQLGGLRDFHCLAELRDFHWNWNSRGRTVQNNTPCCGSRPPAYPSFYTDGHVFRRVKHRSSLGHRIDSARKYSLGPEKMVDSSGTGFQSSETREQSWILPGESSTSLPKLLHGWARF